MTLIDSDRPAALDPSFFTPEIAKDMADRGADTQRRMSTAPKPIYAEVPINPTVQSTEDWAVVQPPTEMKLQYDAEATSLQIEQYIQSRLIRTAGNTVGIQTEDGQIMSLGQFMAGPRFWGLWDTSTPENMAATKEHVMMLTKKYLGETTGEPVPDKPEDKFGKVALFDDTTFANKQPSTPNILGTPRPAAAISIGRLATGFSGIVDAISRANQGSYLGQHSEGVTRKHGLSKGGDIVHNYRKAANEKLKGMKQHVDSLVAENELRVAGFNDDEIARARADVERSIAQKLDRTGRAAVEYRNKRRDNLNKLADQTRKP